MRKFAWLTSVTAAVLLAGIARAQEIDLAVGGSTLSSSKSNTASQAYLPPPEKGGMYASASAEVMLKKRFGFSAEAAFRYHQGLYNGYQGFRPVLYDVNGVFASRLSERTRADFMAGIGGQNVIFYNRFASCNLATCPPAISSTHLLLHAGGGVRYYFWGHSFIRPEAHYYYIFGNTSQFHSGNVVRLGASIGHTFGSK